MAESIQEVRARFSQEMGPLVYPGHPVVIAMHAVEAAGGVLAALKDPKCNPESLVADGHLMAGEGMAREATLMLRRISQGSPVVVEVEKAHEKWREVIRYPSPYASRIEEGIRHAEKLRGRLTEWAEKCCAGAF